MVPAYLTSTGTFVHHQVQACRAPWQHVCGEMWKLWEAISVWWSSYNSRVEKNWKVVFEGRQKGEMQVRNQKKCLTTLLLKPCNSEGLQFYQKTFQLHLFFKFRGKLLDTILDWEDSLPNDDLAASEQHSRYKHYENIVLYILIVKKLFFAFAF